MYCHPDPAASAASGGICGSEGVDELVIISVSRFSKIKASADPFHAPPSAETLNLT